MITIHLTTLINAQIETCFDLARSIEVHQQSTARTNEKAIAGRTSGLCEAGDIITWQATHFGIRQKLTVKITKMNRPYSFEDEMVKGAFSSMKHIHTFTTKSNQTLMTDQFSFGAPLGILGTLAEKLVLKKYMTTFLIERNAMIKSLAETQIK